MLNMVLKGKCSDNLIVTPFPDLKKKKGVNKMFASSQTHFLKCVFH